MFFGNSSYRTDEVIFQFNRDDCNDLATMADMAALYLSEHNHEQRIADPALVAKFRTLCALFSVAHWGLSHDREG